MTHRVFGTILALAALAHGAAYAQPQAAQQNVTAVYIEGLERVSESLVRARLEVQAGQPYNARAVARDIRRIYDLGYFGAIEVTARPDAGGLALTYQVQEKQIIHEIRLLGNRRVRDRPLRGALSLREGDAFVPEAFDEERRSILELYESKGYANTVVDLVAEKIGPARVRLIYTIDEGRKARIRAIDFVGNEAVSDRELRRNIDTRRARWFFGGRYEEEKFETDLHKILELYGDRGRLEAEIPRTDVYYTDTGRGMEITVHIQEGPEYTVDTLEIGGNIVYDEDELQHIIRIHAGDVHNRSQVLDDAELIRQGYQDSGYVDVDVTPQVTLDRGAKTTRVVHNIDEGDLKYIRQITVQGNEVTKDEIIRRQLVIEPGDRFDGAEVQQSQRNLDNTRYFDRTRISLDDRVTDPLYTDLLVDVEEGRTGAFNFGAGYGSDDGASVFGELRLRNFDVTNWPSFSGGGQDFNLRALIGQRRTDFRLGFTDPEFLGYPLSFGFDLFDESYQVRGASRFREKSTGGQLRFGKALSPHNFVRTAFRVEQTELRELARLFLARELRQQLGKHLTVAWRWEFERDTIDNVRDPSSGSRHMFAAEVAGFGGDHEFVKFEHDSIWYRALDQDRDWVISLRTREGWATEYGSSDYIPLQERYYAGGTGTVRGYDQRDIGPKVREALFSRSRFAVGGNLMWVTNVEVRYRVANMFRLYGFSDAGGVWADASDFSLGDMRYSAGIGMGVDVPLMGPIRIDYGYPINPDRHQRRSGRLHLMGGFSF